MIKRNLGVKIIKLIRDKRYLDFIRQHPCCVSKTNGSVAHHITIMANRGMGQKPSDYFCVPLNPILHQQLHSEGEKNFWKAHGVVDPHVLASGYLYTYLIQVESSGIELLRCLNEFAANRDVQ